jgi:hypothetical protein
MLRSILPPQFRINWRQRGSRLFTFDLAPVGFFLFPTMKSKLAGLSLTQESFQKAWERVVRTIPLYE